MSTPTARASLTAVLEPLGIELDGLSTLPEDRGDYLIAAKLPEQGGTLKWKGDVGLNPVASSGEVGLEGVRLTNLLRVIKSPRNFELPSRTLAAGLRYRFAMVQDKAGEEVPWLQVKAPISLCRTWRWCRVAAGNLCCSSPRRASTVRTPISPDGGLTWQA